MKEFSRGANIIRSDIEFNYRKGMTININNIARCTDAFWIDKTSYRSLKIS